MLMMGAMIDMSRKKKDLFWHPEDFNDPLLDIVNVLDGLLHGVLFDYWGAMEPEDAQLPITYWSKERILEYARMCSKVDSGALRVISRMKLEDLRPIALKDMGISVTGNLMRYTPDPKAMKEWRHTKFYSLDVDSINLFKPEAV